MRKNHPLRQVIDFADSALEMVGTILSHIDTGSMNEVDEFGNPVLVCKSGPVTNHVKKKLFHQTIKVLTVSVGPLPVFGVRSHFHPSSYSLALTRITYTSNIGTRRCNLGTGLVLWFAYKLGIV